MVIIVCDGVKDSWLGIANSNTYNVKLSNGDSCNEEGIANSNT